MKWTYTCLLFLSFIFFFSRTTAQTRSCEYTLELSSLSGNGWDGAFLALTINGDRNFYTLDGVNDNGALERIPIFITDGDTLLIEYTRGFDDDQVNWSFFDPNGELVIDFEGFLGRSEPFEERFFCPSCIALNREEVFIDAVFDDFADVSWIPADSTAQSYFLEFGLEGFTPAEGQGTIVQTTQNNIRLEGLLENTAYDFYINTVCEGDNQSVIVGPFSFVTVFAVDVGISRITKPQTACGITTDSVIVEISNFGGNPQTLIPFNYGVNGMGAGVSMPTDGLYTGVLSKDSSDLALFDARTNFSVPGEYIIQSWTELDGDSDNENDTLELKVVNIPIITSYPYFTSFEDWAEGWLVDEQSLNPSWEFGQPSGNLIADAATGQNAWITDLSGNYNDSESSFLVSPCLNFATLTEDPRISFSLYVETEQCCDRLWLESSTDGGQTWRRVSRSADAVNWYNDDQNEWWSGDGGFDGWVYAYSVLEATAGFEDVRLRFVFDSDFSVASEGVGIDNIFIGNPFENDVAAVNLSNTVEDACGAASDSLILIASNLGTTPVERLTFAYQIGAATPVFEEVNNIFLEPGDSFIYQFETPFDSEAQSMINIRSWIVNQQDQFTNNDTVSLRLQTLQPLPYQEDFEDGQLPENWISDGQVVRDSVRNTSFVLSDALSDIDNAFEGITPLLGTVEANDSLVFEYRFLANAAGENLGEPLNDGDELLVQATTDCGASYDTLVIINSNNHETTADFTRVVIRLDNYAGENIRFRFLVNRGADAYFFELDNINITRCPASLQLLTSAIDQVGIDADNGIASVDAQAGVGPYTYRWSNGATTKSIEKITAGVYTVTVTDQFGCTDIAEVLVGLTTDVEEVQEELASVVLAPNPARQSTQLTIELGESQNVNVAVMNIVGQVIWTRNYNTVQTLQEDIDLSGKSPGIYFIAVQIGSERVVKKLIKAN